MAEFTPSRTTYEVNGRKLVLVLDWAKQFKAYWVEDEAGNRLIPKRFYDPDAVRLILGPYNPR